MKTVGIIGSGSVGKALALGFIKNGYKTILSSRSTELRKILEEEIENLETETPEKTAERSELIVFAVKGSQAKQALQDIGLENLAGKTVIDTTNPISDAGPVNGVLPYFSSVNKSLMEELQETAPSAKFVKSFSCVGAAQHGQPGSRQPPHHVYLRR